MKAIIWASVLLAGMYGHLISQPADLWDGTETVEPVVWIMSPPETAPDNWEAGLAPADMADFKASWQAEQAQVHTLEAARWRLEAELQALMIAQQRCARHLLLTLAEGDLSQPEAEDLPAPSVAQLEAELAGYMTAMETLHLRIFLLDEAIEAAQTAAGETAEALELIQDITLAAGTLPAPPAPE